MKHILSLFITMFLLGCATSNVEAQSAKTKVQSKIASYEAEKSLDDIKWYDGEPEGIQLIQIKVSENILNEYPENACTIPMINKNIRSLNLATSVGIVLYEAIRQINEK